MALSCCDACTMNDMSVMAFSPLFQSMIAAAFPPPITCTESGVERTIPYLPCDGIYPNHALLIDTSKSGEEKEKLFVSRLEVRRKDAECLYAVLYTEWQTLERLSPFRDFVTMKVVGTCCAILHNMIAIHRRKEQHAQSPST